MSKPWKTSAWKKKREEFIKDKECEWCGSKKELSIHHKKHSLPYDLHYKQVSDMMLRKLIKERVYKPIRREACPGCDSFSIYTRRTIAPKYRCINCGNTFEQPSKRETPWITKEDWADFQKRRGEEIKEIVRSQREKSFEEYMSFEDAVILCKRCHHASEKGLVLCQVCRERYHRPRNGKCWECFKKTEKGQELAKKLERLNELLPYSHPWCGKTFQIRREWWNEEADPQMCCIEHCDPNLCETASKHWLEEN